ncbi:hypothetical protein Nepgr_025429 [Nepenthes gracilis]|uniref:Uncharacterized protein n=1 Tax=Nepenthes gracilis TaxID=150966 RepID=A0AAD3T7S9_NEPGR|nr:hypothetical protein Nepgr_025429 [Nepenthes gracilis]
MSDSHLRKPQFSILPTDPNAASASRGRVRRRRSRGWAAGVNSAANDSDILDHSLGTSLLHSWQFESGGGDGAERVTTRLDS